MTGFTCLLGGPAFSEFHKQKLVDDLSRRTAQEFPFTAHYVYFVESPHDPSKDELVRLEALLQAESLGNSGVLSAPCPPDHGHAGVLLVVPRLGTQSPWSTKATDIAHRCGLDTISRIERGTLFQFPAGAVETKTLTLIKPLIHHRMTQTVLGVFSRCARC